MKQIYFVLGGAKAFTHYRISTPWKYLSQDLLEENIELCAGFDLNHPADTFVFNNLPAPSQIDGIEKVSKRAKICWSIDDDLWSAGVGPASIARTDYCLGFAGEIWVTTDRLAAVVRSRYPGEIVRVLHNAVDLDDFPPFKPRKRLKKPLFFAGGLHHQADLGLVSRLPTLVKRDFVFFGCLPAEWGALNPAFGEVSWTLPDHFGNTIGFFPPVDFTDYLSVRNDFAEICGIGIAPLLDSVFNDSKSNLKFLEYAALGLGFVGSPVGPYLDSVVDGETGILVQENDWAGALNRLTPRIREAAFEQIKTSWSWNSETVKDCWREAFRKAV